MMVLLLYTYLMKKGRLEFIVSCLGLEIPQFSPEGALESTKAILKRTDLTMDDMDVGME